jgi:hypothetical protein
LIQTKGVHKIGISSATNIQNRLKTLKPDVVVAVSQARADYKKVEKQLHARFKEMRLPQSEYFQGLTEADLGIVVARISPVMDTAEQLPLDRGLSDTSPITMRGSNASLPGETELTPEEEADNLQSVLEEELDWLLTCPWVEDLEVDQRWGESGPIAYIFYCHPRYPNCTSYFACDADELSDWALTGEFRKHPGRACSTIQKNNEYGDPIDAFIEEADIPLQQVVDWLCDLCNYNPPEQPPEVLRRRWQIEDLIRSMPPSELEGIPSKAVMEQWAEWYSSGRRKPTPPLSLLPLTREPQQRTA